MRRDGVTPAELAKAKAQLKARLVFDNDSVTNIAHQLGYFETIASVDVFTNLGGTNRRRDAGRGRRGGARRAHRVEPHRRLVRSAAGRHLPAVAGTAMTPLVDGGARARAYHARQRRRGAGERDADDAGRHDQSGGAGRVHLRSGRPAWRDVSAVARRSTAAPPPVRPTTIAEELDGRGMTLTIAVTRHIVSLICTCLAEDFEPCWRCSATF